MAEPGVVRMWNAAEGWGVIDADVLESGCCAHFSHLAARDFWTPAAGESVSFEWEPADQDGFAFRATRVWPLGDEPADPAESDGGSAYGSELILGFE